MTRSTQANIITNASNPGHRGMLAVVVILGILIILGVFGLIVAAVLKNSRPPSQSSAFSVTVPAPGEHLDSVQTDGNRILLHLSSPKGDEIVILDSTGHTLGRITIVSTPQTPERVIPGGAREGAPGREPIPAASAAEKK